MAIVGYVGLPSRYIPGAAAPGYQLMKKNVTDLDPRENLMCEAWVGTLRMV